MTTRAEDILQTARQQGVMIATAESCTGGLVAAALTEIPGSSDVFERGFVTYSNDAKIGLLGVDPDLIDVQGAVSEDVARSMATGALIRSKAQLAVSITGIAGPGGSEHKPEGRVCFGVAMEGRDTTTTTQEFGAIGRSNVRVASVDFALSLLAAALIQK